MGRGVCAKRRPRCRGAAEEEEGLLRRGSAGGGQSRREQELAADAAARGWERERERHACAMRRIEQLLAELGEPFTEEPCDPIC